jgi:hypothetical protein
MKLTKCEVGMFKLPGIIVSAEKDEELKPELLTEMEQWSLTEQGTGKRMTETLWSFRKESQRDWFILRWSGEK